MSTTQDAWSDIMGTKVEPITEHLQELPKAKEVMTDDYTLFVPEDAPEIQYHIANTVIRIGEMLLDKNRKYGNSALDPLRVHSQATPIEQLKVRADDKLSRLRSAQADDAEDALLDYIGYMILLHIAEKQND